MSWWKEAVFYQVYPRSFKDENGDGIGDIEGLISKLDHLQWLGVDAVWLSPIFQSPQADFGYDISDYCRIDPLFGTMEQVERLIDSVHERGMKLVMDGVFNHTSDLHPWFLAAQERNSETADWYIWSDKPNNWASVFGGSAWTHSSKRDQYYLHTFAKSQPDLNWSNPDVLNAILSVQRFWYEKGVDGFRLDVFNSYCKDQAFRNNPRRKDVLGLFGGIFYGYIGQEHIYDRDRPELLPVLHAFRTLADEYDAVLIGETLDERFEYLVAKSYVGVDKLHLAFDFSPLHAPWKRLPAKILELSTSVDHPAWVWSNHDFPRQSQRWGEHPNRGVFMLVLQLLLKGTPVLYYGEEIDQPHVNLAKKDIVDPPGKRFYPFYKGRDGARTPMNWGDDSWLNTTPWLPVYGDRTVASEVENPDSVLHWCQRLIALRREHSVFIHGSVEWEESGFWRCGSDSQWYVVLNWTGKRVPLPNAMCDRTATHGVLTDDGRYLQPFGFAIFDCSD